MLNNERKNLITPEKAASFIPVFISAGISIILIVFSILKAQVEKINFESANPFSFYHVITDLHNQEKQDCYGILRFPDQLYQKPVLDDL